MIDWVHEECLDWGAYMRRATHGWPSKNMVWRMWRELGASSRNKKAHTEPKGSLQIFHPSNSRVADLHRIWRGMPEELNQVMLACYVHKGSKQARADWLDVSVTRMYELQENAHYYIAGVIQRPRKNKVRTFHT